MSGFAALAAQAVLLLAVVALLAGVVGWSLGSLRATRRTVENYDDQLRATLGRMSAAEAEAVTLRGHLDETIGSRDSQRREVESQENLLVAMEARLASAAALHRKDYGIDA